jgi:hypothetical protein
VVCALVTVKAGGHESDLRKFHCNSAFSAVAAFIPNGKAVIPREVRDRVGGSVSCRYRLRLHDLDSGDAAPTDNSGRAAALV